MENNIDELIEVFCSFCGHGNTSTEFMIQGTSANICDKCVEINRDIIGRERMEKADAEIAASKSPDKH